VEIEYIATWNYRNLRPGRVDLSTGVNVLSGSNGQGKTNLIEALAVVGALRSFRVHRLRHVVRKGEGFFRLEAGLKNAAGSTILNLSWEAGSPSKREIRLNGEKVSIGRYLQVFPMVVVASTDQDLVVGKPAVRRAYLDRLTFLLDPQHIVVLQEYRQLLRQRNAALGRSIARGDMRLWEDQLARAAARVVVGRRRTVEALVSRFRRIQCTIGGDTFPEVGLRYTGEPSSGGGGSVETLAEIYRKRYNDQRDRDRETGYTTTGPHRHDLMISGVTGHVREYFSAGQIRVIAAALRLSFLEEVEEHRGEKLPLGIDDVDTELDARVTRRFLSLAAQGRQLIVTTTRQGLGALAGQPFYELIVEDGSFSPVMSPEEK